MLISDGHLWKLFLKNPGFESKIIILQILFNNLNNKLFLAFNLYEIYISIMKNIFKLASYSK